MVFLSAKTNDGIKSLVETLKSKASLKKAEDIQQKLFVLGSINSGKSSLINALIKYSDYQKK